MAADHASLAAAITAGYTQLDIDRGASFSPRYRCVLSKPLVGEPGRSGELLRAYGEHDVQATAQANALAALNAQRKHRYGFGAGNTGKGVYGGSLTDDLN